MDPREKRSRKAIRATLVALDGAAAGKPLAASLAEALRADRDLGPKERRAAARAARAALRELRRIDAALGAALPAAGLKWRDLIPGDRSLLRYLALRVAVEGEPPARVLHELALPGPRRPRAIADAHLAAVAAALPHVDALPLPADPVRAVAQRRSVPDFLAAQLAEQEGIDRADAILAALSAEPRLDLRANRLLATREEVARRLEKAGVDVRPAPLAPDGLVAADRTGLFGGVHAAGLFEVQDEGSQILSLLCGAQPGETAIDFCAGSGGKSLALAAAVGRTGRVIACDAVEKRLAELPRRAQRAKAGGIVEVAGPEPAPGTEADVVLVDAPCSGIGGLRREPDLRWRLRPEKLAELPALQLSILLRAATFVRPGGRLVYATCSPLRTEDEAVVDAFLAEASAFRLGDPAAVLGEGLAGRLVTAGGHVRLWPDLHDTGAFYAALLVRRA